MESSHQIITFIQEWYWIPVTLLYIGVLVTILIENRNPTKTLAWILVIVFLPLIGMLIYFFFGRRFKKKIAFKKKHKNDHNRILEIWKSQEPSSKEVLHVLNKVLMGLSGPFHFLFHEQVSPTFLGNKVSLLKDGNEKFLSLFEDIKNAKHHIHIEYYIFDMDIIGNKIVDLLIEKVREGVKVRVIIDDFGSRIKRRHIKKFAEGGIAYVSFLPVRFNSLADSNFRNHRKIIVIDGDIAYIGGINIADRYVNNEDSNLYWRDTSVRIQGTSVVVLQIQFWLSWLFSNGDNFQLDKDYLKPVKLSFDAAAVAFATSNPGSEAPYAMESILIAISRARNSIQICTPYFVPSEQISTALQVAAATGVLVELIMPYESDSYIVKHASYSFLKPLLLRNVKVYLYKKGFMHAKTICIDGKLAFIGTVNLDLRSFYINFEISAVIHDLDLCAEMNEQFQIDKSHSELLDIKKWKSRSIWLRGLDSTCRLLAPLL